MRSYDDTHDFQGSNLTRTGMMKERRLVHKTTLNIKSIKKTGPLHAGMTQKHTQHNQQLQPQQRRQT